MPRANCDDRYTNLFLWRLFQHLCLISRSIKSVRLIFYDFYRPFCDEFEYISSNSTMFFKAHYSALFSIGTCLLRESVTKSSFADREIYHSPGNIKKKEKKSRRRYSQLKQYVLWKRSCVIYICTTKEGRNKTELLAKPLVSQLSELTVS